MLNVITLTSRNRVTIPKEVREALGLRARDRLLVVAGEGYIVMVPIRQRSLSELFGALPVERPFPGMDAIREELHRKLGPSAAGALGTNKSAL